MRIRPHLEKSPASADGPTSDTHDVPAGAPASIMQLSSGVFIDPCALDVSLVPLEDVAYALFGVQRWGSHARPRVTVGMHTLAGARYLAERGETLEALAYLHHDDGEAIFGDMCRGIKHDPRMAWYRETEDHASTALRLRFAPSTANADMARVKEIDDASLRYEARAFMGGLVIPGVALPDWCYVGTRNAVDEWTRLHFALGGVR
jgi:hypothetical protein